MTVHQGRSGESRVIKVSDDLYIPLSDSFFLPMPQGPTCKSPRSRIDQDVRAVQVKATTCHRVV